MKRFYSTLLLLLAAFGAHAQAVLNEIYAYPSVGNNEFFELYNTSASDVPTSVDDYQLVVYFDEGGNKQGFYVMDLPNMLVAPKGYFVGSSAIPFNYQGTMNSYNSDFSWNDPNFRNRSTYGYIKRWVKSISLKNDGNVFYDEETVPLNFNDFFCKQKGNGASFNVFLFRNGNLMNSFLGGTGGSALIPQEIIDMPVLRIESLTAANGSTWYATNFNKYKAIEAENVIQDIGSDNGYMRTRDGMCGTWEKSSAQAFHTPKTTNGSWSQMDIIGALTLDTHIYRGSTPTDSSFIAYRIISGPVDMFPAEVYVYADNGSVNDEWDANDDFLKADIILKANDSTYTTSFLPQDQELILVIKTVRGCYDQVRLIRNPTPVTTTLPIRLKAFTGRMHNNRALLEWVVAGNESGRRFEVERSANGREFTKVKDIAPTSRKDEEYYRYEEPLAGYAYYRLQIIDRDGSVTYSPVVFVKDAAVDVDRLQLMQNPVESLLVFNYQSAEAAPCTVNIYNAVGMKLFSTEKAAQTGSNTYTINLDQKFTKGVYILEVVSKNGKSVKRFIKR